MKKVVVYSHDTFGLGNIRRMLAIIHHIHDHYDDIAILLISGSPVLPHLIFPADRFDYVKLPCLARRQNGEYGVKSLGTDFKELVVLRSETIKATIKNFQPDLVLVDKKPAGVANELLPAIQNSVNCHPATQWILLLRDILDNPATTKRIWNNQGYHTMIKRFYRSILVVGSKDVFDIREEYGFPRAVADKVLFCGYMNRANLAKAESPPIFRALNVKKFVLVTPGGGEDGFRLIQTYLQGLWTKSTPDNLRSLIVTGPEMAGDQQDRLRKAASHLPDVEIQTFIPDLPSIMQRAELVISMAGYNTLCEIVSLNKPAIVVPRTKPVEEQWLRANRFARNGWLTCIHPDDLTPTRLFDAVNVRLKHPRASPTTVKAINLDGLPNVSRFIKHALDKVTPGSEVNVPTRMRKSPHGEKGNCRSPVSAESPGIKGVEKKPEFVDAIESSDQVPPRLLSAGRG